MQGNGVPPSCGPEMENVRSKNLYSVLYGKGRLTGKISKAMSKVTQTLISQLFIYSA